VDIDGGDSYEDTHLPIITAPALTELVLNDIKLAPDSANLSWLSGLPKLRRLVLTDLKTASSEMPCGITACSGLTELVLQRVRVCCLPDGRGSAYNQPGGHNSLRIRRWPGRPLDELPDGPYVSSLVRLSLACNGFSAVPPSCGRCRSAGGAGLG